MILDTSFLLDLIDADPAATTLAEAFESTGVPQRVPAQVVYELYAGVGYTDTPKGEILVLDSVLAARPLVETTGEIAKKAGRIDGELRREGERIPPNDLVIGATGLVHDEPVVTRNMDDFERVPGLQVTTY
jgi:predicted nucleic acid-binding protein